MWTRIRNKFPVGERVVLIENRRTAWLIWRGAYLSQTMSWRNRLLIPIYWYADHSRGWYVWGCADFARLGLSTGPSVATSLDFRIWKQTEAVQCKD